MVSSLKRFRVSAAYIDWAHGSAAEEGQSIAVAFLERTTHGRGPVPSGDRRHRLVKAGALILAEMERLDREQPFAALSSVPAQSPASEALDATALEFGKGVTPSIGLALDHVDAGQELDPPELVPHGLWPGLTGGSGSVAAIRWRHQAVRVRRWGWWALTS